MSIFYIFKKPTETSITKFLKKSAKKYLKAGLWKSILSEKLSKFDFYSLYTVCQQGIPSLLQRYVILSTVQVSTTSVLRTNIEQ